ncbi:Acyl-CoA dehydrogenase [Pseudomonas sp. 9AZ]|uniref:acyl-CoA dehydrogenase family protein n=1 Tax=Pseudomonas sp. 9AZ TaxID=2653168 RepID=UPI0012F1B413|nr:acyl-CoA dehydrogenase family protein [Pseudomonas sp. 9AZ]VXD04139.1 Acyl-CoA dehydrogenase [Pseudomonas sp. 9AZ]
MNDNAADNRLLIRDALREILRRIWPMANAVTSASDAMKLCALWVELCQNGVAAMEDVCDLAMVMHESGRAAAPIPLLGSCIATRLLARIGNQERQLEAIQTGDMRIALAFSQFDGDNQAGTLHVDSGIANGALANIEDWAVATHLLAFNHDGTCAALINRQATGLTCETTPGFAVPSLARLSLHDVRCELLSLTPEQATELVSLARLLLAARASGAARRGFELAIDYAKLREQFGQVIGHYQAIQHKLADCAVTLDVCDLMIENCANALQRGSGTFETAALFALASPGLRKVALELHHTFGAIGYAEEHELPRHFRRIHADMTRLGGAPLARLQVGRYLLENAGSLPELQSDTEAERLRGQVRNWLGKNWDEAARQTARLRPFAERDSDPVFIRALGKQGWLAVNWPKSHGGMEFSPLEQLAFVEEMHGAGVPIAPAQAGSWLIAPALIKFGTQPQRDQFLPLIASGEARLCLGYSEPQAGSDLASLRTKAIRDGDDYLITGQKLWTTLAETATHIFLAARTDLDAKPKHAGISLFIVPSNAPGVDIKPGMALYGRTFSTVFYDEVRVPAANLIGPLNGGWGVLTSALASERVLMGGNVARLKGLLESMANALQDRSDDPIVIDRLGGLTAELQAARLLVIRSVQMLQKGKPALLEGAISKLFTGDFSERFGETALELFGTSATLSEESLAAPMGGVIEQHVRASIMAVIGGGTAEIQRNLIAQRGFGLPR